MPRTRRNFTAEYKAKIVLELISRNKSAAEVCREYNLKADLVSRWKSQFLANAAQVFGDTSEIDPQQTRIQELERLAGKQSLEIEILKKTLTLLPRVKGADES